MFKNIFSSSSINGAAKPVADDQVVVDVNPFKYVRFGGLVLLFGFGGFVAWAALAPLDAGVPSQGTVIVASNTKSIQQQTGGTIEKILVEEGAKVKKGQLLLQLNVTEAESQLKIAESQFISAQSVVSRLQSEKDGLSAVKYDSTLQPYMGDARFQQAKLLQDNLFQTRRSNLLSEIGMLNEEIGGLNEQLSGYIALKANKESQARWMKSELEGVRDLAKEGYLPKNKLFQLERSSDDVNGSLADAIANIGRVRNAISETKIKILSKKQEYQKEVESQLTDVQKDSLSLVDKIKSLRYTLDSMSIRSPIDGFVMGMNVHTVGGVIQPGFHIMDVVPNNESLIVESQVSPELISKVKVGLPVDLNFTSLDRKKTPVIPGEVSTISADRLTEQRTGTPYFLVRVKVTREGMVMLGHQQITPGMPTTVVVKTGERTMLNYLVKPLFDRVHLGMKEE